MHDLIIPSAFAVIGYDVTGFFAYPTTFIRQAYIVQVYNSVHVYNSSHVYTTYLL